MGTSIRINKGLVKLRIYLKKHRFKTFLIVVFGLCYIFCLPEKLFITPNSTLIESKDGELLGALIASDGQWRFPDLDVVPDKFKYCIVQFEDEHFYEHPGFNPISMFNALRANIKAKKTVRGGSTITQQVIRLSRQGQSRSYFEKLKELILATRLEFKFSKEKILKMYVSHAPYGGNVVGLEAASWRYFNVAPTKLSWGQSAMLAVLPNAPSLLYPGKNADLLLKKRNRLLKKLLESHIIDQTTYNLSIEEDIPTKPKNLPQVAPHLLQRVAKKNRGERIKTSIDLTVQELALQIVNKHYTLQSQNGVYNMAALILDVKTKKVISYIGNTNTTKAHHKDVDIITAPRSTGSILKPFLYMSMLDTGELLPETILPDVPTTIGNYKPENFTLEYLGAVSAKLALAKSLNIPAVRMLYSYGITRFYDDLQSLSISDINKGADHYGLSLILGGAEGSLWDICSAYSNLASTLVHFNSNSSQYYVNEFQQPNYNKEFNADLGALTFDKSHLNAGSIYFGFEAMKELNRPSIDNSWRYYNSAQEIAWKTGTSYGNRDAWSVGVTKDYVVGVWVGNADGEGRPGVTGTSAAAPVMFDLFDILPKSEWFATPYDDLIDTKICTKSGQLASDICPSTLQKIPAKGLETTLCKYHKLIHLDQTRTYQVNTSCEKLSHINTVSQFVLPPLMAWYYKKNNVDYKTVPPLRDGCKGEATTVMAFSEPVNTNTIIVPKGISGARNKVIFKVAHNDANATLYWYVDDTFLKSTTNFNEVAIDLNVGEHIITVLDHLGNSIQKKILVK
ncbi:penicillin-binding protein 1C [Formosa algae]|uniref:peptidoglycan glycosyltransferase n=1 Tax=Formosa algae TaxID=225843 RepID=A0A9X0YNX8_9FLAO|nr:penicillin-binding protein 1C [Formosa algae]MBP1841378.1 penicillin-binding protein 1C [Formosa algae]MDQ0336700.1 penicillin-binding protein 1C [Formosa algae]OEI78780.1 penicillin-binding protein 1C [Formosa algae]